MAKSHRPEAAPHLLICLLLTLSVAAIYLQAARFGFVDYDDDTYVFANPNVTAGLSARTFRWAFSTTHAANWHPVTWLSLQADVQMTRIAGPPDVDGKPNARLFHLTSIFLHLANSLLLYLLLFRVTGHAWRSGFVALLFAVHPLHVESVAWVAERKDVLSTLFWLLTMVAYAAYVKNTGEGLAPDRRASSAAASSKSFAPTAIYMATIALYALGLMSKPMLVTLPVVLLLMDYWPLGRVKGTEGAKSWLWLVVEKSPMLLMAAASGAVTYWAQQTGGAVAEHIAFGQRAANALVAYCGYIVKTIVPSGLAAFYPHPGDSLPTWQVIGSAALIAAVTWSVIRVGGSKPYLAFGWFWYVITLLPVIGLVQVGNQAAADRYTYVPLIGLFVALTWGAAEAWPRRQERGRKKVDKQPDHLPALCGTAIALALVFVSCAQIRHWSDTVSLFSRAAAVTRDNYVAHFNLGRAMIDAGRDREAVEHYRKCVRLRPRDGDARVNLGVALARTGDLPGAVREYREAARLLPRAGVIRNNIGCALDSMGDREGAEREFLIAARLDPKDPQAFDNLGLLYAQQGDFDKAVDHFRRAHELAPGDPVLREKLERAMADQARQAPR